MKLLVLTVCYVAVLATTSGDFERKRELEKVLDELSNALTTAEEANTDEEREGNKFVGESGTKEGTDAVQYRSADSIDDARDGETFTNSIKSHTGENNDGNLEENFLDWLLDAQAFDNGDEVADSESNADWDNLFDTDIQEMNDGDFDNKRLSGNELEEELASSIASESGDKAHSMSDGSDQIQESRDDDQSADLVGNEMSLDDEKFDTPDTSDDTETDSSLKMMKATDGKVGIDDDFKDFIDIIQTSDTDDASSESNHLQMRDGDDFIKMMSEMGESDDTTDDDFSEFLDMVESSDIDDEEDSDSDSFLDLAHKLFNQRHITSEEDSLQAKRSDHEDVIKAKPTVSSNGRFRRRLRGHLRKPHTKHSKGHGKGKLFWKVLGHRFYYKKYRSILMKYYRLRKRYYGLKNKCRRVLKACKKTAFKVVSNYCKKVHKKMNNYHKVRSRVRGCRDSKKCKFYEKTTTTTRNYYNFMYKIRPTAVMCSKLIKQYKG